MTCLPHQLELVQRWRERRDAWRPAGERVRRGDYTVDVIAREQAKRFVEEHHYAGTFTAARLSVGLYRGRWLVGVAAFSVSMQARTIPARAGVAEKEGLELGRFVLLDEVPGNGETYFLGRAFRLLRSELPEVRAVVSYSDPVRRRAADGRLVLPGHIGTIYQAHNGRYVGRGAKRTLLLDADGRVFAPRALSKIRNGERGGEGAYRRLLAAGAPPRSFGEDWPAYLERVRREGPFRSIRHPGCHCYVWALEKSAQGGIAPAQPYPKQIDALEAA